MRLAQLARKIAVKPAEIAAFLAANNSPIEDSSNAKVAEDQVELVLKHFAPELLITEKSSEDVTAESSSIKVPTLDEEMELPSDELASTHEGVDTPTEVLVDTPMENEVIKPIKVELPGLKVVGKIELPEPKKKEEKTDQNNQPDQPDGDVKADPQKEIRPRKGRTTPRNRDLRPRKNVIALQREREAREALRKRQEEAEREKELRTQRYLKKVSKYAPPPKPLKKNKHEDEYEVFVEKKQPPKSLLGKILNWFVSE